MILLNFGIIFNINSIRITYILPNLPALTKFLPKYMGDNLSIPVLSKLEPWEYSLSKYEKYEIVPL